MSETAGGAEGATGDAAEPDREAAPGPVTDPGALEYRELQRVAKRHGVTANLARDELVNRLRDEGAVAPAADAERADGGGSSDGDDPADGDGVADDGHRRAAGSPVAGDVEVLEFTLGDERYCVDIANVAEIVDAGEITTVPGTGDHVEGVMDLRGTTTRVVNPKRVLAAEDETPGERIVVVDLDGGTVGWLVDEVHRVAALDGDVDDTIDDGPVEGVVQRDDGFVVLLDPAAVSTPET